jgi:hypothetical protein
MAENEYIERGARLEEIDSAFKEYEQNGNILRLFSECRASIIYAPAADVVEVCRCKDCKHYQPATPTCGNCFRTTVIQHPEDFCSRGERKEATP